MRYTDITFRPLEAWPGELTRHRQRARFSAPWGRTVTLLERELTHLGARLVVFQIAVDESDLRLDGKPRSTARPSHPGTVLAFESKWGPLKYVVDTFDVWQDNVRAIALGMEALRAVDRYGVTKRGEQYTGWKALPSGSDDSYGLTNPSDARDYLARVYGGDMKRALMETHPDRGGDREEFGKVMRIKALLNA